MPHRLTVEILGETAAAITRASDAEAALSAIGQAGLSRIGDPDAAHRPGALKPGEVDQRNFGFFLVLPGRERMMLFAEHGWPAEQHRLVASTDNGRPGWTVQNGRPCVCPNTDEDPIFTQILKTARMGSTIYAPLMWRGAVLGLINFASQARHTYAEADLPVVEALGHMAASAWIAHGGPELLAER